LKFCVVKGSPKEAGTEEAYKLKTRKKIVQEERRTGHRSKL